MNKKYVTTLITAAAMALPAACNPVNDNKGNESTPIPQSTFEQNRSSQLYNGLQNALTDTENQQFASTMEALAYFLNKIEPLYTNCELYGVQWSGKLFLAQSASGYSVFKEDSLDPGNCVEILEVSTMDPRAHEDTQGTEAITLLIIYKELMHGPAATYIQDLEASGQISFSSGEERAVLLDGLATLSLTPNQREILYSGPSYRFILTDQRLQMNFDPSQTEIDNSLIEAVNVLRAAGVLGSLKDGRPESINPSFPSEG